MAVQTVKPLNQADWVVLDEDGAEPTEAAPASEREKLEAPPTPAERLHTNTPAIGLKSSSPEPTGRESPAEVPDTQPAAPPPKSWFNPLCCFEKKV